MYHGYLFPRPYSYTRIRDDSERAPLSRKGLRYFSTRTIIGAMPKTASELLADVSHYMALAQVNYTKAQAALRNYERAVGKQTAPKRKPSIKSLRIWGEWLAENGPATRQTIMEATGHPLTERALPHTVEWDDLIDPSDDGAFPATTIMRLRGVAEGRGAPPVIYFLWSQRFDVRPLFGVGPEKDPAPMLGVVYPVEVGGVEAHHIEKLSEKQDTIDAWLDRHSTVFDQIKLGGKPDAEQRLALRSDAPEGVDVNIAIALASSGRLSELTA